MDSLAALNSNHVCLDAVHIGRIAIWALYSEVTLDPKPGLVTPKDNGSHCDMDVTTFMRSLFSLRDYFPAIVRLGAESSGFSELKALGISAEKQMLKATGGINTHRGGIFNLGLLAAATGYVIANKTGLSNIVLGEVVKDLWGSEILNQNTVSPNANSHGEMVAQKYGVGGAREEAGTGFPSLYNIAFPTLKESYERTNSKRMALIQTLFALVAELEDTNVLYRGGPSGLKFVQKEARRFLKAGGVYNPSWLKNAREINEAFKSLNLSPGGSADLLSAAWFVYAVESRYL